MKRETFFCYLGSVVIAYHVRNRLNPVLPPLSQICDWITPVVDRHDDCVYLLFVTSRRLNTVLDLSPVSIQTQSLALATMIGCASDCVWMETGLQTGVGILSLYTNHLDIAPISRYEWDRRDDRDNPATTVLDGATGARPPCLFLRVDGERPTPRCVDWHAQCFDNITAHSSSSSSSSSVVLVL